MRVYGRNVFNEFRNTPSKLKKVFINKNMDEDIFKFLKDNKIQFEIMDTFRLNKLCNNAVHQGIVMEVNDYEYSELKDVMEYDKLLILDHLQDPHNFGAIIRTSEALGIKGIIIPRNRGVMINDTVMKVSAGALTHVKIVMENNLVNVINKLKEANYFIYGADMDGKDYFEMSYAKKVCLVIGSEGEGMSRLVKESCDEIVSIPMSGQVNSLNASVAAAIIISKIVR